MHALYLLVQLPHRCIQLYIPRKPLLLFKQRIDDIPRCREGICGAENLRI
jgi:hypothetical protein